MKTEIVVFSARSLYRIIYLQFQGSLHCRLIREMTNCISASQAGAAPCWTANIMIELNSKNLEAVTRYKPTQLRDTFAQSGRKILFTSTVSKVKTIK